MRATSSRWPASRRPAPATRCAIRRSPVILEKMEFPEPVIEIAIEPKSKADQEKLGVALAKLAAEDPSFRVNTDQESGQTIIRGMGELHLDIKVDILKRTYKVEANIGAPAGRLSREDHAAGHGRLPAQEADRRYRPIRPGQDRRPSRCRPAAGFVFENEVVGGAVPKEYIPGVEKGLESVLGAGVLAGFPVVDLKVTLIDGRLSRSQFLGARLRDRARARRCARRCRRAARCCSSRS